MRDLSRFSVLFLILLSLFPGAPRAVLARGVLEFAFDVTVAFFPVGAPGQSLCGCEAIDAPARVRPAKSVGYLPRRNAILDSPRFIGLAKVHDINGFSRLRAFRSNHWLQERMITPPVPTEAQRYDPQIPSKYY